MNYISLNIKYLTGKEKVKKDEFGRIFGLNRGAISAYISEKAQPKIETLQKISAYFQISIDDLINTNLSNPDKKEDIVNPKCEKCDLMERVILAKDETINAQKKTIDAQEETIIALKKETLLNAEDVSIADAI